jgi:hypothetical protein
MRIRNEGGLAYSEAGFREQRHSRWLQAGLNSSAYRLAHLAWPRPLTLAAVTALFYLV